MLIKDKSKIKKKQMYDYDKSLQPNNSSNKLINFHEINNRLKLLIKRLIFFNLSRQCWLKM